MKFSLKQKIASLVLISNAVFLAFNTLMIVQEYRNYLEEKTAIHNAQLQADISTFVHNMQIERGKSVLYLNGHLKEDEVKAQREKVDEAYKVVQGTYKTNKLIYELEKSYQTAYNAFTTARKIVDDKGPASDAVKAYSESIGKLIQVQVEIGQHTIASGEEKRMVALSILEIAKENAGKLRATVSNIISEDKALSPQQVTNINVLKATVTSGIESPALLISDRSLEMINKFKDSEDWVSAQKTITVVLEKSTQGQFGQDQKEYFKNISSSIDQLATVISGEYKSINKAVSASIDAAFTKLVVLSTVALFMTFFLLGLGWYITQSISRPIQSIMSNLQQANLEVHGTSGMMADSGNKLSESTQQQAAALQETVASLDEIGSMIQKTADNAKRSQEVSQKSAEAAEKGQTSVNDMLTSMSEISSANDQIQNQIEQSNQELSEIVKVIAEIAQKTKVINDIVFQTKLLSFNASVEAARAGEAGKGFAVVAEEVGNLATMSGNAAKEITEVLDRSLSRVQSTVDDTKTKVGYLIDESKQKVAGGIEKANYCNDALSEIVNYVREVDQLVMEIATASTEQSLGIQQISTAMNQLDMATQSNAANAQVTAASSEGLKNQADHLNEEISSLNVLIYGGGKAA